jgi:hypothetical protein
MPLDACRPVGSEPHMMGACPAVHHWAAKKQQVVSVDRINMSSTAPLPFTLPIQVPPRISFGAVVLVWILPGPSPHLPPYKRYADD